MGSLLLAGSFNHYPGSQTVVKSISVLFAVFVLLAFPLASQAQGLVECALGEFPREVALEICDSLAEISGFNVVVCPENGGDCAGTSENDCIVGSDYSDIIDAGKGQDIVIAIGGDDHIIGGQNGDLLLGGAGKDVIEGGWGEDRLCGGQDDDVLDGGRCDDQLTGGVTPVQGQPPENDNCLGGKGLDLFLLCEAQEQGPGEPEIDDRCDSLGLN